MTTRAATSFQPRVERAQGDEALEAADLGHLREKDDPIVWAAGLAR